MFPQQNQQYMQTQQTAMPMQGYTPQMTQQQPMLGVQATQQNNPGKYKTQLCRHYKNGNCSLGSSCLFAHGEHELRGGLPGAMPTAMQQPKANPGNYKTVQCKYFTQGFCKNSASCNFAHGDQDSRAMMGGVQPQQQMMGQPMQQQQLDPNVQILIMILQNLEQLFPQNQEIVQKLRTAQEHAQASKTQEATAIILEIMEDPKRTPEEKQSYQTIYKNAQLYYQQFMNGQQQQVPQQQ